MSHARVFEWHRRFREGEKDVENKLRSGRPSSSKMMKRGSGVTSSARRSTPGGQDDH